MKLWVGTPARKSRGPRREPCILGLQLSCPWTRVRKELSVEGTRGKAGEYGVIQAKKGMCFRKELDNCAECPKSYLSEKADSVTLLITPLTSASKKESKLLIADHQPPHTLLPTDLPRLVS